mgnify:CR=1 FL=1
MKRLLSFFFITMFLNLQAAEELTIAQVGDGIYSRMDALGIADKKTINLQAPHEAVHALRSEITEHVAEILRKVANAKSTDPKFQALQFQLLNSSKTLRSIEKAKPLTITLELYIAGYMPSAPIVHKLVIHNDKITLGGIDIPVSSKFHKVSDKARTEFKDVFTADPQIGKTPGKIQSI